MTPAFPLSRNEFDEIIYAPELAPKPERKEDQLRLALLITRVVDDVNYERVARYVRRLHIDVQVDFLKVVVTNHPPFAAHRATLEWMKGNTPLAHAIMEKYPSRKLTGAK